MKLLKSIYSFAKITLPICCLFSCDYLNVVPPTTADFNDTMVDRQSCLAFLYSCYGGVETNLYATYGDFLNSTDESVFPVLWNTNAQKTSWDLLNENQGHPWNNSYNYLGQCNLFLKELSELNPTGVTEDEKTQWKSEVYFLQAYYHFLALEAYGPIPLMNHYYSQQTATKDFPGRSHFDCCVDSIAAWYDKAAEHLPATVQDKDLGRATSTACKALKARLLLYAASPLWNGSFPYQNWKNKTYETPGYGMELVSHQYDAKKWERALQANQEALDWAINKGGRKLFDMQTSEDIRNAEKVPLPSIVGVDSTFRKRVMLMRYLMTTKETSGNTEAILAAGRSDNSDVKSMLPHAIVTYNGTLSGGWCGFSPTLYSVEHFYTQNGKIPEKDPDFYPKSQWLESAGLSNKDIIKLNVAREPRFYAWMCFDGGEYSSFLANGKPLVIANRDSKKQGYNPSLDNRNFNVTGYYCKKGIQPNLNWSADNNSMNWTYVPVAVIRLAELYLNLAECYAALGQTTNALDNLNIIRERAGIPDLKESDITADMTLMDWVRNERFVELWEERERYFDVRRWMIAPEVLKSGAREGLNAIAKKDPSFLEYNQRVTIDQPFDWSDRMYMVPINKNEVYSNPNLIQSPGY